MIKISIPMNQEFVKETLLETGLFTFVEKQGINLFFNSTIEDQADAIKQAKAAIKAKPEGSVLYFQVTGV